MIDVLSEPLLSFAEAAKLLPVKSRPAYSTMYRWWKKGIGGLRLSTAVVGGRRFTTASAIREFSAALSARDAVSRTSSKATKRARLRAAERELAKHGIL